MLGQIANYCPIIARNTIIKSSVSLAEVWQRIRQHYRFQASGSHFLDLSLINLSPNERHEDLYQCISAFLDDNLLAAGSAIKHHGAIVTVDEEVTPTIENTVTDIWLHTIHTGLPQLVKQKYGTELKNQTLASIKPEISYLPPPCGVG